QRAGRAGVDAGDAGAGQLAADDLAVQHAGQPPVRRVVQRALDLVDEVVVRGRLPDHPVPAARLPGQLLLGQLLAPRGLRRADGRHDGTPSGVSAAWSAYSSTASRILV